MLRNACSTWNWNKQTPNSLSHLFKGPESPQEEAQGLFRAGLLQHTKKDGSSMTMSIPEQHTPIPASVSLILDVVELIHQLAEEQREATPDEQNLLAHWMGWGPVAKAFDYTPEGYWAEVGARLRMLLGPDGTEAAAAATPHSFFTAPYLAEALWDIAMGLGFTGGKVLEPGCGSGAVLAGAPKALPLAFTGIEREPFSARVAQTRFPHANIINAPLEKTIVIDHSFDLVVGNVPFSSTHIYDRNAGGRELSLHNYFIWRALQALRPGGLAVLISSRFTLDAVRDTQRDMIAAYGTFLGAIRLPSRAHEAAKTDVVTDILVFQKKTPSLIWEGHSWFKQSTTAIPGIGVNEYFDDHMHQILGTPRVEKGRFGDGDLVVQAPEHREEALHALVASLVQEAEQHGAIYLPPVDRTVIGEHIVRLRDDGLKEGSYHVVDGQLIQIVDGDIQPVKKLVAELTALVHLRNAALNLLEAERDLDRADEDIEPLRQHLNTCYDAYVRTYGAVHRAKIIVGQEDPETGEKSISRRRPPAMYAFSHDPDYAIVLGLEEYDDETQQAHKAPIFRQRIHVRPSRKDRADSPAEALALCLDEYGTLDLERIGHLLAIAPEEVPALLGTLIYEHPHAGWQLASEYLSGNVRDKLDEARQAAERQPERYSRNVTALEAVIPEDLLPEEIKAILGAPWLPTKDIEQFCQDIFGLRPVVNHIPLTGAWQVSSPSGSLSSAAASSEWGTARVSAYHLVELGLNQKVPVVYDVLPDDSKVKNVEESIAAQDKLRVIQARFSEWVWEDTDRATRLAEVYNRTFNAVVPRSYDGSHLSFPGMSEQWQNSLYSWQKDFVWRMVSSPAALCGHPVGAGKTTTEIAGAMTLKRMGLTQKAAIIVPNHLLEQITSEAQRLYPGAHILMVSRDDLSKERRKLFAAKIATGNYDFVVMTHSGLSAIGVHPETETAYIEQRIAAYREALLKLDEEDKGTARRSIKQLETAIEKMRQRQEELLDKAHDDGVTFEQLGISYFIVDEFHLYKNLGLPTNIQGLQVKPSKRSTDLEMKLRWLEQQNAGRPFASGFTATPLSNSMVEAYVIAWYLNQDLLTEYGLRNVDAFASTFIEFQTRVEVSPNGASFRLHTRPARFVNVPEFLNLFTQFADLRGPEILSAKRPHKIERTITIEPSDEVQAYVDELVERSEEIQQGRPREIEGKLDNMLWITSSGRMAALDLSLVGRPQEHAPKLEAVAANMLEVFHRWQEEAAFLDGEFKSLQIGFCDLGTPNDEDGDQIYGKLKLLLLAGGIPSYGIRFIHEAKSDGAKAQLFQHCRNGQVAVLLGSTTKLGTGTNIQTRGVALHHIDAPWRPDEVEQREGRVQRPGNVYPQVEIFRYVQRRTFDAYSWQTLANKAVFFDQMRSGKIKGREMDELGDAALSFGQVKAAATGDILILEQADLNVTVAHLQRLRSAHLRSRKRDQQEATIARNTASDATKRADLFNLLATNAKAATLQGFVTSRGSILVDRSEAGEYIASRIQALLNREGGREGLGTWSGIRIDAQVRKLSNQYVVELLIGGGLGHDPIHLSASQEWITKGQRWRFAHAVHQLLATAEHKAEGELVAASKSLERAQEFEKHAQDPFPQEEDLHALLNRKKELDTYTSLAAAAKGNTEKMEEVAKLRAQLLKDTPMATEAEQQMALPVKLLPPARPAATHTPPTQTQEATIMGEAENAPTKPEGAFVTQQVIDSQSMPAPTKAPKTTITSKATLLFGNLEHIGLLQKRRSHQNETKPEKKCLSKKTAQVKKEPSQQQQMLWDEHTPLAVTEEMHTPPTSQLSLW